MGTTSSSEPGQAAPGGSAATALGSITRALLRSRIAVASVLFALTICILSALVSVVSYHDPAIVDPGRRLLGPSGEHWLGTDDLGRDVLTRALYGARVSFLVGAAVTLATAICGTVLGLVSAYYPRLDGPIMRVIDGLMAFPSILLAIALMASLGPSTSNVVLTLSLIYTAPVARLARGAALVAKQLPYVESARMLGASDGRVLWQHILPNVLTPIVIQCTFTAALAIVAEASLSFLGAGVPPNVPTWGNMLRDGQRLLSRAWWVAIFPGTALFLTALAFNLLGDVLRDALDPRTHTLMSGVPRQGELSVRRGS